jgi:hypothetical protein
LHFHLCFDNVCPSRLFPFSRMPPEPCAALRAATASSRQAVNYFSDFQVGLARVRGIGSATDTRGPAKWLTAMCSIFNYSITKLPTYQIFPPHPFTKSRSPRVSGLFASLVEERLFRAALRSLSTPVIPTENRTTLSEAEGEASESGRIPRRRFPCHTASGSFRRSGFLFFQLLRKGGFDILSFYPSRPRDKCQGTTSEVAEKSSISALHLYSRGCSPTQKLQHGPDFSVRSVFKDTTALVLHRRN